MKTHDLDGALFVTYVMLCVLSTDRGVQALPGTPLAALYFRGSLRCSRHIHCAPQNRNVQQKALWT